MVPVRTKLGFMCMLVARKMVRQPHWLRWSRLARSPLPIRMEISRHVHWTMGWELAANALLQILSLTSNIASAPISSPASSSIPNPASTSSLAVSTCGCFPTWINVADLVQQTLLLERIGHIVHFFSAPTHWNYNISSSVFPPLQVILYQCSYYSK